MQVNWSQNFTFLRTRGEIITLKKNVLSPAWCDGQLNGVFRVSRTYPSLSKTCFGAWGNFGILSQMAVRSRFSRGVTAKTSGLLFCRRRHVRLRWVWYRYPSVGLPMMHVLVVPHLFGCVEMEIILVASSLSLCDGRLNPGLVSRSETPGFPSKIYLPGSTNTIPIPVPR